MHAKVKMRILKCNSVNENTRNRAWLGGIGHLSGVLTNYCPSVLWHCWLGYLTRKSVPDNAFGGTLNFTGPDCAGGGPGANIKDGSSLFIHWSSGSHKISTNWANQYDIYFGGDPYCPPDPINPALKLHSINQSTGHHKSRYTSLGGVYTVQTLEKMPQKNFRGECFAIDRAKLIGYSSHELTKIILIRYQVFT